MNPFWIKFCGTEFWVWVLPNLIFLKYTLGILDCIEIPFIMLVLLEDWVGSQQTVWALYNYGLD